MACTASKPILNRLPMYYHYLGRIPYRKSLALQEDLVQKVKNMREFDSNTPDILLLLEHPLTYTEGRRTKLLNESLKQKLTEMGSDYVKTMRGGQTTLHNPGQLVGYPIMDLKRNDISVKCYVSYIEKTIIGTLSDYQLKAQTTENTGVWIGNESKVCSIGVQIQRYITSHGFALNCNNNLKDFELITPCGLKGVNMTSIGNELGGDQSKVSPIDIIPSLIKNFELQFNNKIHNLSTIPAKYEELKSLIINNSNN